MDNLEVFENKEFGKVRTVLVNNEPYFVGKDVAEILGYERATKAISDHVDEEDKDEVPIQDSIGRMQKTPIINESGLYSLILSSKLPTAKKFKRWVTSEVLPSIRKTGTYTLPKEKPNKIKEQEVEARLRNARVRESNQYLKIAAQLNIPEYKYILQSKAAETLAGVPILPMQEAERKTYSATEIGNMFGVSANRIGKLANANGLKTEQYGKLFYSKSGYSVKEVETWRYYDTVIPVFAKLIGKGVA